MIGDPRVRFGAEPMARAIGPDTPPGSLYDPSCDPGCHPNEIQMDPRCDPCELRADPLLDARYTEPAVRERTPPAVGIDRLNRL